MNTVASHPLVNCAEQHLAHPDTFEVPSAEAIGAVRPGDFCKLIFEAPEGAVVGAERMWVQVTAVDEAVFVGTLANEPVVVPLGHRDPVQFTAEHVADVTAA